MEANHAILLAIYLGPFVLAAFMPGWRTLAGFGAVTVIFGLWLILIKQNESGGIALSIEKMLLWLAFTGAVAGILARAATLFLARAGLPGWTTPAVLVVGASILPVLFATGLLR